MNRPMRVLLLACICLALFVGAQNAQSQPPPKLVFILDASGSMWGQIGGENKIVIARRELKELVAGLDANTEVALVAYGHRRKGDCADIETIVPLGPLDKAALGRQIDALNPTGKTPITASVNNAFDLVKAQQGPATIVLLSDGLETCGGDPCQAVQAAKKAGLTFVMHVIGFDVGADDVSQLECAAQSGGGLYFDAKDASELATALDQAVAAPPEVPNGRLSIKAVADGKLTDVVVRVVDIKTGKEAAVGRTYTKAETNPRVLPLAAGVYDVTISAVGFKGAIQRTFKGVRIGEDETVEKAVDFSTGELGIEVRRNGALSDATVNIYVSGTTQRVAGGRTYTGPKTNPAVYRLTPGEYDVVVKTVEIAGRPEQRIDKVTVESRGSVQREVDFASGTLRVGATHAGELIDVTLSLVSLKTGKSMAQGRTYTSPKSNPKKFELAPGQYRVILKSVQRRELAPKDITVTIAAGQALEKMVAFGN